MPVQIVDADFQSLRRSARSTRVRSPETVALVTAIEQLDAGKAKAIDLDSGETVSKIRARLVYAARIADRKLRVASEGNRVLFVLRGEPRSTGTRSDAGLRRQAVQAKALELARGGKREITAEEILSAMVAGGDSFDVARPATMVGAVLRSMPQFERTGRNVFRYTG